jgi:hypothetical protein
MTGGWALVDGVLQRDGMPVGRALPDGWKLAEGELELNGMSLG